MPLHTTVESFILNKKSHKDILVLLKFDFFLSSFTLHPCCHPSGVLWALYSTLELPPRKHKGNMVSKLLSPGFLTAFPRPMLIVKI